MNAARLYFCEGYCPLTGPVRDLIHAAGFGDARTKFFMKHRVSASYVCLER